MTIHTVRVADPSEIRPNRLRRAWARFVAFTFDRGHWDYAGCMSCGRPRVRWVTVAAKGVETYCSNCGPHTGPFLLIEPEARGLTNTEFDLLTAAILNETRAQHYTHQEARS